MKAEAALAASTTPENKSKSLQHVYQTTEPVGVLKQTLDSDTSKKDSSVLTGKPVDPLIVSKPVVVLSQLKCDNVKSVPINNKGSLNVPYRPKGLRPSKTSTVTQPDGESTVQIKGNKEMEITSIQPTDVMSSTEKSYQPNKPESNPFVSFFFFKLKYCREGYNSCSIFLF